MAPALRDVLELLVACCRAAVVRVRAPEAARERRALRDLIGQVRDWPSVLDAAAAHGVAPLCAREIEEASGGLLSPAVRGAIADIRRASAARALAAVQQLAAVHTALHAAGIAYVTYKGPSLAAAAYGDPALRTFDDLDIIVSPAEAGRAFAVLGRLGYAAAHGASWATARSVGDWQGQVALARHGAAVPLELHWRFCDRKLPWNPEVGSIAGRSRTVSVAGATVRVPAPDDHLALVVFHAARHGWDRLEPFACVGALIGAGADVAAAWRTARAVHGERAFLAGLGAASRLVGAALPPTVAEAVACASVSERIGEACRRVAAGDAREARDARLHLSLLDGPALRARYFALAILLPTPQDRAAVPLPAGLGFLYPIVRLARLAWRAVVRPRRRAA